MPTAASLNDPDEGDRLATEVFADVSAPATGSDPLEAMTSYAVGANNLAGILLGRVALDHGVSRAEACELLAHMVAEIEDDLGRLGRRPTCGTRPRRRRGPAHRQHDHLGGFRNAANADDPV